MLTCLDAIGEGMFIDDAGYRNVGVLIDDGAALVINPGNRGIADRLKSSGVREVDIVLFTHHRRELADGLPEIMAAFHPQISAPAGELDLFTNPDAYWSNRSSRWYLLCGHVPYHVTHVRPIPCDRGLRGGEVIEWHGWRITVIDTPGYTDGSVSYLIGRNGKTVAFVGDLIYAPGKVRDFYSLQHEDERNGHRVGDYHGFLGSIRTLLDSLDRVLEKQPTLLVPAHGEVINDPVSAVQLLKRRVSRAYENYASISALRWYFPRYFEEYANLTGGISTQETLPLPECVRRLAGTTWMLRSENGRALLIDPCSPNSIVEARKLLESGEVAAFDGIWITHYHYDHMESVMAARSEFGCPVMTDRIMADVLERPTAYFLTCLSPNRIDVDRHTQDGETWRWEDFTLTAWHFPGQTYYHSGLLAVDPNGRKLFFAGDSFTPTGIDDYCSWNRNFLGDHIGYSLCIEMLKQIDPDIIFNQHVDVGFRFTQQAYEAMLEVLDEREKLFAELLPWDDPNFGTDEYWVNTCPYEQTCNSGEICEIEVRITNHSPMPRTAVVSLDLPDELERIDAEIRGLIVGKSEGRFKLRFAIPPGTSNGRYVIPVLVTFGGIDLGSFREAIVNVM